MKHSRLRFLLVAFLLSLISCSLSSTRIRQSVVMIRNEALTAGGTGFHINTASGALAILTNAHICQLADSKGLLWVNDDESRPVPRRVIEISQESDLCLVEPLAGHKALPLAANDPQLHDHVREFGHPLLSPVTESAGEILKRETIQVAEGPLFSEAEVAKCKGPHKHVESVESMFGKMDYCLNEVDSLQTSVPTYPGNSGSPMLDGNGSVVGIFFAGDRRNNAGYAVPVSIIKTFLSAH